MEFLELAKKRYSCRQLSNRKVEQDKIEKILQAAQVAPTAVNKQPFHIWVMESNEAKEVVSQSTNCTFNASVFFVVGAKKEEAWIREYDQRNFGDVDASIVATHMMLEIEDLGLSTTWVGHFDPEPLKKAYSTMKDYDLIALFPTGYAETEAVPSPRHTVRKDIDAIVDRM